MTVGPQCDIQPMSFNVTKNHCTLSLKPKPSYTTGKQGDGFINGKKVMPGKKMALNPWDRVVFGNDLYMFMVPGAAKPTVKEGAPDPTTADFAATEFREALKNNQTSAEKNAFKKQMVCFGGVSCVSFSPLDLCSRYVLFLCCVVFVFILKCQTGPI